MSDRFMPPTYPTAQASQHTLADGRYVLVREVAEGGTALVHLGFDTWTDQWRAIKTLLPEYAKRPALRHRFEREAATMKALSHPNIIAVYDGGIDDDVAYMVMEYAEGGSVTDWIERHGPMPPRMATEVVLQLCEGVEAAHRQEIVHRDIKPQNLLVDRDGNCKVTDFGIAQVLEDIRMTMTGTVMGTIGYMAPEQHESAKHADKRADVYSIAATFYTLLKGEAATHLFMAEDSDLEGIPAPLARIVRRGSEYRREARYPTIREMAHDLREALKVLQPDPLDTPPLVSSDLPILEDITPPSFSTVNPRAGRASSFVQEPPGSGPMEPAPLLQPSIIEEPLYFDTGTSESDPISEVIRPYNPPALHSEEPPSCSSAVSRASVDTSSPRFIQPYSRRSRERRLQLRNLFLVVGGLSTLALFGILAFTIATGAQIAVTRFGVNTARAEMQETFEEECLGRVTRTLLHVAEIDETPLAGHDEALALYSQLSSASPTDRDVLIREILHNLEHDLLQDLQSRVIQNSGGYLQSDYKDLKNAHEVLEASLEDFKVQDQRLDSQLETFTGRLAGCAGF